MEGRLSILLQLLATPPPAAPEIPAMLLRTPVTMQAVINKLPQKESPQSDGKAGNLQSP
jgi:hypothetical protein